MIRREGGCLHLSWVKKTADLMEINGLVPVFNEITRLRKRNTHIRRQRKSNYSSTKGAKLTPNVLENLKEDSTTLQQQKFPLCCGIYFSFLIFLKETQNPIKS